MQNLPAILCLNPLQIRLIPCSHLHFSVYVGLNLANMSMAVVGDPVGVIAAQSIGEPGTQMTLHGKRGAISAGGVDVTQGLPRVEELFEARTPKVASPLAEISGKVEVTETDTGYKVRIRNTSVKPAEEREYLIPLVFELKVADGDLVTTGTQLAAGSLDIKEVLEVRGLRGSQEYLIEEIQAVYDAASSTPELLGGWMLWNPSNVYTREALLTDN